MPFDMTGLAVAGSTQITIALAVFGFIGAMYALYMTKYGKAQEEKSLLRGILLFAGATIVGGAYLVFFEGAFGLEIGAVSTLVVGSFVSVTWGVGGGHLIHGLISQGLKPITSAVSGKR